MGVSAPNQFWYAICGLIWDWLSPKKNRPTPPHPREVPGRISGVTTQKCGKFHELPRKWIICFLPPPIPNWSAGGVSGQNWRREERTDGREGGMSWQF